MSQRNEPDWETLISTWIDQSQQEEDVRWAKAAVAKIITERFGVDGARQFASQVGVSARLIHKYRQTFDAFPDSSSRIATLTFEHHYLASCGESPSSWIEQAEAEGWSIRELRHAILRAESDRQIPPPAMIQSQRRATFEANDLGVAIIGEQLDRFIFSKRQWQELIRLLSSFARSRKWLGEGAAREMENQSEPRENERRSS